MKNQKIDLLREEVTAEEIASIVSRWTGIPVTKLSRRRTRKTTSFKRNIT